MKWLKSLQQVSKKQLGVDMGEDGKKQRCPVSSGAKAACGGPDIALFLRTVASVVSIKV